jgi:DNA-binding MarR family transcriptional regulator
VSELRRPSRPRKASAISPSPAALGVVKVGPHFADEYPDGNAAAAEAYATLIRTGQALLLEIERTMIATFGVPQSLLNSLAVIDGAGEPLTPSQISERTLISSATMTGTLDALEYGGWVRRLPHPEDRRSLLVEITDEGAAVADLLLPGIRKVEQAVFAQLNPTERRTLLRLLAKVLDGAATVAQADPIPLDGQRIRPARLP